MKLIHISDLHFTSDDEALFCGNPKDRFERCVAHVNATHADADLCVITGDLTHWGERSAYESLRDVLAGLALPAELLLGNHDDRDVFRSVFPAQAVDEHGHVQSVRDTAAGRCVFMDTLEPGTHAGAYGADRLGWLKRELEAGAGRPHYLFMHHHPMPVKIAAMDRIGQQDAAALRGVLAEHSSDIRHLFFGHCHLPMSGAYLGIPFSSIRSVNHPLWPDYAAETITIADVAPHYAVVLIDDDSLVVHHEEFLFEGRKWDELGTTLEAWAREDGASSAAAE